MPEQTKNGKENQKIGKIEPVKNLGIKIYFQLEEKISPLSF